MTDGPSAQEQLVQAILDELPRARRRAKVLLVVAVAMMATLSGVGWYLMQSMSSQQGF